MRNPTYATNQEPTTEEEDFDFDFDNDDHTQLLKPENRRSSATASAAYHKKKVLSQCRHRLETLRCTLSDSCPKRVRLPKYQKMSAAAAASKEIADKLDLAPLRTLDDFVLGSARFQLPNLRDLEKWGNRVVKNLLYYQTNYFLMFVAIYLLMIVTNPVKIACGLLVQALLIAIFLHFFRVRSSSLTKATFISSRAAGNPEQKWYFLAGALLFGYLLLYWFDAVLLTIFTLLLPVSLTFIHASLRLRNIKNKMVNAVESFSPSTPMAVFLDALNIKAESLLS